MVQFSPAVLLLLCSIPALVSAFMTSGRLRPSRRQSRRMAGRRGDPLNPRNMVGARKAPFFKNHFQTVTVTVRHQSTFLECEAGGSPVPTIHWLKDGVRLTQSTYETVDDESALYEDLASDPGQPRLRLSSTKSRLYLDCPTGRDQGEYTCVAETPYKRRAQSTIVKVDSRRYAPDVNCMSKRGSRGEPARVYMWTVSRLELETTTVQLFCRASGYPEPMITWYDGRNNTLPDNSGQFSIAANGDLVIQDISWLDNMGVYRCVAENEFGSQSVQSFLYPTTLDEPDSFPV